MTVVQRGERHVRPSFISRSNILTILTISVIITSMNYKREGLLLPEQAQTPADTSLFESFQAAHVNNIETYTQMSLEGDRKDRALEQLRNGEDVDVTAHELDEQELADRMSALKEWKRELIADQSIDADIKQAYRWRVNEDIANIHMLEASRKGDMNAFRRWNEFIYGKPDEVVYRAALDWVASDAEAIIAKPGQHEAAIAAAQNVLDMLDGERGYRELLAPDAETFEQVKNDHMREGGYYALLLAGVEIPSGKVTNETGDPVLEHVVRENLQSDYDITDSSSTTWSVAHSQHAVKRPKAYNMPRERYIGLGLGHEIGSHLLERVNGDRGPLKLASQGLDRYEDGNEGRATIREQVPYDTFDEFGKLVRWRDILRRHIAVSYGHGVGEDAPHTSRETYAFVNAIDTMYQAKLTPGDPEATAEKAHRKTGLLITRVLRGVDGEQGGAYLKDKVYLEGHVACWLTAAEHGSQAISEGDLGKFDINNPRHINLLQKMGALPNPEE